MASVVVANLGETAAWVTNIWPGMVATALAFNTPILGPDVSKDEGVLGAVSFCQLLNYPTFFTTKC